MPSRNTLSGLLVLVVLSPEYKTPLVEVKIIWPFALLISQSVACHVKTPFFGFSRIYPWRDYKEKTTGEP